MNHILFNKIVRSRRRSQSCARKGSLCAGVAMALLLGINVATAAFHIWSVTEVYSSADGSVQFIALASPFGFQNALGDNFATITSSNALGINTYTFPTNLPSTDTAGHFMILGTASLASIPGGITPNYIIPPNFILPPVAGADAAVYWDPAHIGYSFTNLPTDGASALFFSTGDAVTDTNLMVNFSNETNTIVPVQFSSSQKMGTNFVMSFPTATGINGSAGPTYTVEYKNLLSDLTWTPLTSAQGDGTTQSASNSTASASQQIFRLNVH